jgi:hypothetical protein
MFNPFALISSIIYRLLAWLNFRACRTGKLFRAKRPIASSERIKRHYEGESVEIRIAGVNLANSMLAHQDRRVRIVHQVTAQMGDFTDDFGGYQRVAIGGDENAESRCGKNRLDEPPRLAGGPGSAENPRMRADTQKLI